LEACIGHSRVAGRGTGSETKGRCETPRSPREARFAHLARELDELPGRIDALEAEQNELARKLADPALYQDRTFDFRALNARQAENVAELDRLLARWTELETRRERSR
jgi:ATP-binding cassette subfamily F protein uup